ncbi:MAG: hypothetical protein ACREAK_05160 [Nitrosarchaeum sp.]
MKIIYLSPLALILPILIIFGTPTDASIIKYVELEKNSLLYGESFQYTIIRTQINGDGGEHVETRFINKSTGTASEWSPVTLEDDRHTIVTSKITGNPFDKKGDYILEVKYAHPNSGFLSYADFQMLDDADSTRLQGTSHLLSPNEQRYAGLLVQDIKCNEGLELIKKSNREMSACVKPETKQKLIQRGWAISDSPLTNVGSTDLDIIQEEKFENKIITTADNDKLISIKKGESFVVQLDSNYNWRIDISNNTVVDSDYSNIRYSGSQGVYTAHNSGQAILTGVGDPLCLSSGCMSPSILFQLNIIVE